MRRIHVVLVHAHTIALVRVFRQTGRTIEEKSKEYYETLMPVCTTTDCTTFASQAHNNTSREAQKKYLALTVQVLKIRALLGAWLRSQRWPVKRLR